MPNTRKSGQTLRPKKRPRPTLRSGRGSRTNSNTSHQIPARVIEADSTRNHSPFNGLARGDHNITFTVCQPRCGRRLTRGASNVTEALASKTCTPCRGGIPPLTREQAELFHAQAPDWQLRRKLTASSGASGFAISGRRLPLFRRLVNSRKLKAIIRISASVGAMRRSLCRPRRSRDCMRTTSSWPPKLTAFSLGRPRRE